MGNAKQRHRQRGRTRGDRSGSKRARVAVALGGVAIALTSLVSVSLLQTYRQHRAVREIWRLGGYVKRQSEMSGRSGLSRAFGVVFGEEFSNPVLLIRLAGTDAEDTHLKLLRGLDRQELLDLRDTRISDAGLRRLHQMQRLRLLILTGTAISNGGLSHVVKAARLEVLCLEETNITDDGLCELEQLPSLTWLNLSGTQTTDAGLMRLASCRSLRVLLLDGCPVTPRGLQDFQRALPHVRVFSSSTRRPSLSFLSLEQAARPPSSGHR